MDLEYIRDYALKKSGVKETYPFGDSVMVFKVNGRIFLLLSLDSWPRSINLKCDPEKALDWREHYCCVLPGYHMNKKHWNTVLLDGTLCAAQVREMIDDSYRLVNPRRRGGKKFRPCGDPT